jgi:hypothetical protein
MSRELKFRIWDDKTKTFDYFDLRSTFGHIPNDLVNNIQQCLNIKDSNGAEIYEGDYLYSECDECEFEIVVGEENKLYCKIIGTADEFYPLESICRCGKLVLTGNNFTGRIYQKVIDKIVEYKSEQLGIK